VNGQRSWSELLIAVFAHWPVGRSASLPGRPFLGASLRALRSGAARARRARLARASSTSRLRWARRALRSHRFGLGSTSICLLFCSFSTGFAK
jgi:hypothetical protein